MILKVLPPLLEVGAEIWHKFIHISCKKTKILLDGLYICFNTVFSRVMLSWVMNDVDGE